MPETATIPTRSKESAVDRLKRGDKRCTGNPNSFKHFWRGLRCDFCAAFRTVRV